MRCFTFVKVLPFVFFIGCVGAVPDQNGGGGSGLGTGDGTGGGLGQGDGGLGQGGGDGTGGGLGTGGGDGVGDSGANLATSQQVFASDVLPLITQIGCQNCHPMGSHDALVNSTYMGINSATSPFVNVSNPHAGANPGWANQTQRDIVTAWAKIYFGEP